MWQLLGEIDLPGGGDLPRPPYPVGPQLLQIKNASTKFLVLGSELHPHHRVTVPKKAKAKATPARKAGRSCLVFVVLCSRFNCLLTVRAALAFAWAAARHVSE